MKQIVKKVRNLAIVFSLLFVSLSATVSASEPVGKDDTILQGPENTVNLETDGDYIIEFIDTDFECVYTGEEIRPEIKVFQLETVLDQESGTEVEQRTELSEESYEIEYLNNVNAGTATINVTGKEEEGYAGTIFTYFEIAPKSIENAQVTLGVTEFIYYGNDKVPSTKVKLDEATLKKGVDYSVSYLNNCEVGMASVIISGKGNYTGITEATFTISLGRTTVKTAPYYNKIKVSWSKVTGASGYDVWRSNSYNGGYKIVKKGTTSTSYTDTDVVFDKKYYYVVKAYRIINGKKIYAENSDKKSQKVQPATPSVSKISKSSSTALKITWNKIGGATGYAVYRSDSEKGTYARIATIKSAKTLSYTDVNCSCGKTYYYKVRAYRKVNGKNYYSSYSVIKSGNTTPGKVTWNKTSTTYNSTSITLKWKKVSEATGYAVYRSKNQNGTYTKVKTISKNSTLSWKDTGLEKGVTYYYKIRSYKKVGETNVYGSYSSIFTKSIAGWKYVDGYKLYYNNSGKLVKDVSNLIGKQSSYVIKVNKKKNTVTVYAKDGKNGYIIPVKAFICSTGAATPLGTFKTPQKIRWHELDGPSYGQWCTRITGHILFHSVWYYKPQNTTLSVTQYNKLGTQASHGCVRLTAGDAKWIYDNCKLKTKVVIYNSSNPGPLGKPTALKLKSWHTWDPTDPNMKTKCAKKGCH